MSFFRKKPDAITERARALSDEIAALEAQIEQLSSQVESEPAQPRLRSTALPHAAASPGPVSLPAAPEPRRTAPPGEPIFERVDQGRLQPQGEAATTPHHYNELGVRKYDLPALLRRMGNQFRGPSTTNPKLVSYLAAGGIQGLRPLRYEKRVARNRFIVFVVFLVLVLLGLITVFVHGSR